MITDTHSHLDFPEFQSDLPAILDRAEQAGVHRIITIGTTLESSRRAVELAAKHPQIYAVVGVHPNNAFEAPLDFTFELRELARHPKVVAIGETGLDYYRLPSSKLHEAAVATQAFGNETLADVEGAIEDGAVKTAQARVFEAQIELALDLGLNIVVHQRAAWEDTLSTLRPYTGRLRAVFHCFGEAPEAMEELMELGHLVSFTGIITFPSAEQARASAVAVPINRFMLETDCPYLSPVPFRGQRCEPAYTRLTADKIAQLRGLDIDVLAAQTESTANHFFRFEKE